MKAILTPRSPQRHEDAYDEAAIKLLFPAIRNAGVRWRRAIEWTEAMSQFAIVFADRFPGSAR